MRTLHVCISDRPGHTKQEYPLISIFQNEQNENIIGQLNRIMSQCFQKCFLSRQISQVPDSFPEWRRQSKYLECGYKQNQMP